MKHISALANLFDNVVSRDQILRGLVHKGIFDQSGVNLQQNQIKIGQTVAVLQHLLYAERVVILQKCDLECILEMVNQNPHGFSLKEIIVK